MFIAESLVHQVVITTFRLKVIERVRDLCCNNSELLQMFIAGLILTVLPKVGEESKLLKTNEPPVLLCRPLHAMIGLDQHSGIPSKSL